MVMDLRKKRKCAIVAILAVLISNNIEVGRKSRSYYNTIPKMINWFESVVPQMPESRYKYFFRMSRTQYMSLETNIYNTYHPFLFKGLVSIPKRIHLVLYYLGHNDEMQEMSDRFALATGCIFKYIKEMVVVLAGMFETFVQWPTESHKRTIMNGFSQEGGINNYVNITGVGEYRAAYTTRKLSYAVNLTVVSGHTKKICYAIVGCPGSYNDSRVFTYTPFSNEDQDLLQNKELLFGDSGYTLTNRMIIPCTNPTPQQMAFNYLHSRMRVIVENCFGLLKGKWKIVGTTIRFKKMIQKVVDIIKACMVLHNICLGETIPELDVAAHQIEMQGAGQPSSRHNSSNTITGIQSREDLRIAGV